MDRAAVKSRRRGLGSCLQRGCPVQGGFETLHKCGCKLFFPPVLAADPASQMIEIDLHQLGLRMVECRDGAIGAVLSG